MINDEDIDSELGWMRANTDFIVDGHIESMAEMLETSIPIPPETRQLLASYLRGKTKLPDMRGRKNSALSPTDKEWIEGAIHWLWTTTEPVLLHAEAIADDQGKEPLEIRKYIQEIRKTGFEKIAFKFNMKVNTVRQMCKPEELSKWEQVAAGERTLQFPNGEEFELFGDGRSVNEIRHRALTSARTYMKHPDLFFDPLRYNEGMTE